MKIPGVRVVFDRKHQATKEKRGLVQIEVLYEGKKKYITTGVKITSDCWSEKMYVKDCLNAEQLRKRIKTVRDKIEDYVNNLIENDEPWNWTSFETFLNRIVRFPTDRETFLEFVKRYKDERQDIRESTRKTHNKLINALVDYDRIKDYCDLTKANIYDFDDYLRKRSIDGRKANDAGVYNYNKLLKAYINETIMRELTNISNPYFGIKFKKGESKMKGWLTEEEMEKVRTAVMPTDGINKVRDFSMLQYYTGLAYTDLFALKKDMFQKKNDMYTLSGVRQKTGVSFYVVLLHPAIQILEKYNWHLPYMTNQQYNMRLKIVAQAAGIGKPIASHWLRRSAGMFYLNHGMSYEIVAKILGHKTIQTTQKAYARIMHESVEKAFENLVKNIISKMDRKNVLF